MAQGIKNRILGFLLDRQLLDKETIADLLLAEEETGETLDKLLIQKADVEEEEVLRAFSHGLHIEFKDSLDGLSVPDDFAQRVPILFARNHNLVGIGSNNGSMIIATCTPMDLHPLDEVSSMLNMEVETVLAQRTHITSLINRAYQHSDSLVDETLGELDEADIMHLTAEVDETADLLDVANKAPVIKLVNMILFQALKMRASDVHIQPYEDRVQIRYRIDGVLYDMIAPPKKVQDAIISRIKIMGKMDIAERRLPQDGGATINVGDSEVDLRISSIPTSNGERIVFRLLDRSGRRYAMQDIGFTAAKLDAFRELIACSHGIVLVTGPTGSGKSTTLYAALTTLNAKEKNILTIEDPIEYKLAGISQTEVSEKKGLTFATGLRSIMRQDPDIIMVGEIRDSMTATIAIQSALTGHLVFSTLHTNDASSAPPRLIDLGVEPYLVASTVIGVLAQRLVRLICKQCKTGYNTTPEELKKIGLTMDDLEDGQLYRGRGCDHCFGRAYLDRTAIYELFMIDDQNRDLITEKQSAARIKQHALKHQNLETLRMDGASKVAQGLTTIEEVLRITQMDVL